jgi:hypothetical protein
MSKFINLSELSSTIDRSDDYECYEITVSVSDFMKQPAYHYSVSDNGKSKSSITVFDGALLLTPELAAAIKQRSLFAIGIRNDATDDDSGLHFNDIVVSFFSSRQCFVSFSDEKFLFRNFDEVARLSIYGSGPYYRVSVSNIDFFDTVHHRCELEDTDDALGVGVLFTDADGINKLRNYLGVNH